MTAARPGSIINFPPQDAAFPRGAFVRLDDGREGHIQLRHFLVDQEGNIRLDGYEIGLAGGQGRIFARPPHVRRWMPTVPATPMHGGAA